MEATQRRNEFGNDIDGICKSLMPTGPRIAYGSFPEPPDPTCRWCDAPIPKDDWCGPDTPTLCDDCEDEA